MGGDPYLAVFTYEFIYLDKKVSLYRRINVELWFV